MTERELNRLMRQVSRGNEKALDEIIKEAKRQANLVNKRLKNLEKAGLTNADSYKKAQHFLSSNNLKSFTGSINTLKGDTSKLARELRFMNKFMEWRTSSVKGYMSYRKETFDRFRDLGLKLDKSKEEIFDDFLRSDIWNELKEFDSSYIFDAERSIQNGASMEKLIENWDRYQRKEIDMVTAFEKWTILDDNYVNPFEE